MNLYLIERTDDIGYDEYDADVVAALSIEAARKLSNVGAYKGSTVRIIGKAEPEEPAGIVLASFNAG